MEVLLGFLEVIRWVVPIVCVVGAWTCVVLMSRMRSRLKENNSRLRGMKAELTRVTRRSRHWKHYAHILEMMRFGNDEPTRTAFRSRYIHDFKGWGTDDEAEVQPYREAEAATEA